MNMHVMAPIAQTGYGYVSMNIIKSLVKNNHNVSLTPIGGSIGAESQEEFELYKSCYEKLPDYDKSCLGIGLNTVVSTPIGTTCIGLFTLLFCITSLAH